MYSVADKAAQKMIADAIAAQWDRPSNLYGAKSGDPHDSSNGRDAAAQKVHRQLEDGYVYVATLDIKNAFGSVDPDALYSLPLAKETIARNLDLRNRHFEEVDPPSEDNTRNPRSGSSEHGEDCVWRKYLTGWKDGKSPRQQEQTASERHVQVRQGARICEDDPHTSPENGQQEQILAVHRLNHNHAYNLRVGATSRRQEQREDQHASSEVLGSISTTYVHSDIQSELCPTGIAQGSAASPIIFAMLLTGLPNALDDAQYLVCHDDIIVMARTPEARSSMIIALADFFAGQCQAGSLTMEQRSIADGEPFEWLGYAFDPSRVNTPERGISVGERSFLGLAARLNKAENEDIKDLETYRENRASHRPCAYPVRTWHALNRWRSGCRAVHPEHEDLKTFIDGSRWVAVRYARHYRNDLIVTLHDAIFDDGPTQHSEVAEDRNLLRSILRDFPPLAADQLPTSNA